MALTVCMVIPMISATAFAGVEVSPLVVESLGVILHSDQGVQFTSKAFTEYCGSEKVLQSMSKAGFALIRQTVIARHLRCCKRFDISKSNNI